MTIHKSGPLNANGVPIPAAEAQVLKNGLPSSLPDIDVQPIFLRRDEADSTIAFAPHNYPRDDAQKTP